MTTRVVGPFKQAWRKGVIPWLKLSWDREPVLVAAVGFGVAGLPLWVISPWKHQNAIDVADMPTRYPVPIRYVEGETGPPTSL